jgi:hypothetical protein
MKIGAEYEIFGMPGIEDALRMSDVLLAARRGSCARTRDQPSALS